MGFTAEKAISFDFDRGAHRTGELRRVRLYRFNNGVMLQTLRRRT
ncbi:hypothetical protein ACIN5180_1137 [Acinetobacter baumannii OIFC180]|nr:hypothetical protein ACIN5180_1137 [Acinetobacter baumannii OIFC180]